MKTTEYVAGFLLSNCNDYVLLIMKQKPDWQAGKYNAVGGKVERNETAYDAMVREFKEETDLALPPGAWTEFCLLGGSILDQNGTLEPDRRFLVHFFRACGGMNSYQPVAVETEVPRWVVIDDVVNRRVPTISNLRWLVPMAFSSSEHDWPYMIEERGGA
jgi:8-oxo-dGTP diphosphatase